MWELKEELGTQNILYATKGFLQPLGRCSISHQGKLVSSSDVVRVSTVKTLKMSFENQMLFTIGLTFIGISLIIFIAGVIVACRQKPEDQNEELRGKG